jgi:hypothetical protein
MKLFGLSLLSSILASAATLTVSPPPAHAATMTFFANLSAANEVQIPAVVSPGIGLATIVLDPEAQTLQVNAIFVGLTSGTVAAHIHCCGPIGTNVGVATTLPAFPGFPIGVTQGTYSSPIFDLTQPLIYNPAFVTAQGGLSNAEAALIAGIIGGQTYFNIHTSNFPAGEIRGQLATVPLPAALPLFAAGLGVVTFLARRKKAKAVSPT